MNKILLLSPHFDDAILSAGQLIAGRPDAEVVTVFGGFPSERQVTDYDVKCGFSDSGVAVVNRRVEDNNATALLSATSTHWELPDGQYGQEVSVDEIKELIIEQLGKEDYDYVLGPLGLGHPDHIKVSDALVSAWVDSDVFGDIPVYLWEDMPLRVIEPDLAFDRRETIGNLEQVNLGSGPIADKIRALLCYKSQIGTGILDPYIMYVPERFWELKP